MEEFLIFNTNDYKKQTGLKLNKLNRGLQSVACIVDRCDDINLMQEKGRGKEGGQEHLVSFFCYSIFSNFLTFHFVKKKAEAKSRAREGWPERTELHPRSPLCALQPAHICPCSTLFSWTGPNSATVYLESFFILWSSAAKFSSTATRFSFIVCWTWKKKTS